MLKKSTMTLAILMALTLARGLWAQTDATSPEMTKREGTNQPEPASPEARRQLEEFRQWYERVVKEKQEKAESLARDTAELKEVQKKIQASASWIDDNLVEKLPQLSSDAVKFRVELAGLKARQAAVEQALSEQLKAAAMDAGADEIVTQLQELVKLKEEESKRIAERQKQFEAKNAPGGDSFYAALRDATADLIETRIKLAERREAIVGRNFTPATARLRDQLVELAVSISETQAKLDAIQHLAEQAKLFKRETELSNSIPWEAKRVKELEVEAADMQSRLTAATQPSR